MELGLRVAPMPSRRRLFGLTLRKAIDVIHPGSRGGRFYFDEHGHVRYGEPPHGAQHFSGLASQQQVVTRRRGSGFFAGRMIGGPEDSAEIFRQIVDDDRERCWLLHLDAKYRPRAIECVSQGSISASIVHPREVYKNALALGTKRVIIVHNHPSGDPNPSREDMELTARLVQVGEQVGVTLEHHLVVGRDGWFALQPSPMRPPAGEWRTDRSPGRQLSQVESHLGREKPTEWPEIWGQQLQSSADVYRVAARLLDPGDAMALALVLDNKHRTIGVFPIAGGDAVGAEANLTRVAFGTSASAAVVVGGQDGPTWQQWFSDALHERLRASMETAGIRYLDTVSVGADGFLSMADNGSIDRRRPYSG